MQEPALGDGECARPKKEGRCKGNERQVPTFPVAVKEAASLEGRQLHRAEPKGIPELNEAGAGVEEPFRRGTLGSFGLLPEGALAGGCGVNGLETPSESIP